MLLHIPKTEFKKAWITLIMTYHVDAYVQFTIFRITGFPFVHKFNFGFFKNQELKWTVPQNPKFIVDGTRKWFKILSKSTAFLKLIIESIKSMNDINQGGIGDCWFLASLSSLGTNAIIIYLTIKMTVYNFGAIFEKWWVYK